MGRMKDLFIKLQDGAYSALTHEERAYLASINEPAPGVCLCRACSMERRLKAMPRPPHRVPDESAEQANASF
jgi:hypothetical protein